jgi:hypothetical protein
MLPSCDFRSGIAKENMEKYTSNPTPTISPTPAGTPIALADIVEVDAAQDGDWISVDGYNKKATTSCKKFNRVMVNGDSNMVTVEGACRQIMINGNKNEITADASMEFMLNGIKNIVKYSRFPNGKLPSSIDNGEGNTIERISVEEATNAQTRRKTGK